MADFRQVFTRIWDDEWFADLAPEGKTFWLYLLTNARTSVAGIYTLPRRVIAGECGLPEETVTRLLGAFAAARKIVYDDKTMWVVNMRRYQQTKSGKVQTGITNDIAKLPDSAVKRLYLQCIETGIDTLSIVYPYTMDSPSIVSANTIEVIHTTPHHTTPHGDARAPAPEDSPEPDASPPDDAQPPEAPADPEPSEIKDPVLKLFLEVWKGKKPRPWDQMPNEIDYQDLGALVTAHGPPRVLHYLNKARIAGSSGRGLLTYLITCFENDEARAARPKPAPARSKATW